MTKTAVLATLLTFTATSATAVTLTFDGLGAANITSYSEGGYTLSATNPSAGKHIGDNLNSGIGTFGWHSGGSNDSPQGWVLTQDGGGAFDFLGFQFDAFEASLIDVAFNGATLTVGEGTYFPTASVDSVTFSFSGSNEGWIDNIVLSDAPSEVPVPGSLPLAATAALALGLLGLRRRKST